MDYPLTAIISDIHGNEAALDTTLDYTRAARVERYVCLGDVVGYGARPTECLERIMELCVEDARDARHPDGPQALAPGLCLRGNHEQALLEGPEDFNPKARAAIEWTKGEINSGRGEKQRSWAWWDFLGELPVSVCDSHALFVHGSPRDPVREYMVPSDVRNTVKMGACFEALARYERSLCFIGHSHVPAVYAEDCTAFRPRGDSDVVPVDEDTHGRLIINVGSLGQPRDGDARLSFALFDGRRVTFVRLAYNHDRTASEIRSTPGLPDYLAERLTVGR